MRGARRHPAGEQRAEQVVVLDPVVKAVDHPLDGPPAPAHSYSVGTWLIPQL